MEQKDSQLGKMEKVQMEVEGECSVGKGAGLRAPREGLPEPDGHRGLAAPANTPRSCSAACPQWETAQSQVHPRSRGEAWEGR